MEQQQLLVQRNVVSNLFSSCFTTDCLPRLRNEMSEQGFPLSLCSCLYRARLGYKSPSPVFGLVALSLCVRAGIWRSKSLPKGFVTSKPLQVTFGKAW